MVIKENTPTIYTNRLILRRFEHSDTLALFELLKDTEVNTYLPWFVLKNLDEAKVFLKEKFTDTYKNLSGYRYALCLKQDNIAIGYIWLSNDDSNDFGYALKKEYWNQKIISEAAKALVERIKNAGYPYITATHDINNPQSGAIMKKLGMEYKYSYIELWQPKNIPVTFRMYQLNFDGKDRTYLKYWNKYDQHFIEDNV